MSGNSLKENAIHVFKEFEYELQSVCENSINQSFSKTQEDYTALYTDFLSHTIPDYYYCLTDSEKNQYVFDVLLNPMYPASFLFSSFFNVIHINHTQEASSVILLLFYKFLSSRIISLLVEITTPSEVSGNNRILQQEHYDSVMRNLLHACDIVNNQFPRIQSPFFVPTTFIPWLSDAILRVFLCHSQNPDSFSPLLTKSCILGYTPSFAAVYYRYLQLYERCTKAINSDERLFVMQPKTHALRALQSFLHHLPSLRSTDFITHLLQPLLSPNNQISHRLMATLLFASGQVPPPTFISILISQTFPLQCTLSFVHSLYQIDLNLSYQIINTLLTHYNSPSFSQTFSTQQQILILSLLYGVLRCNITFTSTSMEESFTTEIMKGIGNHLSTKNERCKEIVIGLAILISKLVSPEGNYQWPDVDLHELNHICNDIQGVHDQPEPELEPELNETPEEVKEPSVPDRRSTQWLDMDEIVDIFEEETKRMMMSTLDEQPEEEEHTQIDGEETDEEDFIPYDLSEPMNRESISKQYYYIVEPLPDFTDQDLYKRIHAWKALVSLCKAENTQATEHDCTQVLRSVIEMDGMQGDEDFWQEYQVVVATLLYRYATAGMQVVFNYAKENSQNNITIVKCGHLLQAVIQAANMLVKGNMTWEEQNLIQEKTPEVVITPLETPDANGLIRVANTRYKSSYYRNKLKESNQPRQLKSTKAGKETSNRFTGNAKAFLDCLLTWIVRFPPRNTTSISYLLIALSSICKLPILHGTFDECYPDIVKVILRYRYHKDVSLRRNSLELFIIVSKYEYRDCLDRNCEELQVKEKVQEWMQTVYANDPDDLCRLLAKTVLAQLSTVC